MECNKDDAIRAMEIAETKMRSNDFEGAKRFALKAQNLYPQLVNINQMLSICNVHCSGRKKMGSDKDWYGILQAENFVDEATVKKQYRRLALFLHPDKNRFPGAEAAFKLICEANAVLSDPSKKSIYDSKVKAIVRLASVVPPPHNKNKNSEVSQKHGGRVNVSTAVNSVHQHQERQTSTPGKHDKFWRVCPFCSFKCQDNIQYNNHTTSCPKRKQIFTGHDTGAKAVPLVSKQAQGVPVKPTVNQSYGFQEKEVHTQGTSNVGVQNGQKVSSSHAGFLRKQSGQPNVKDKQKGKAEKVGENGHAHKVKTGTKNKRRRGGKFVAEFGDLEDEIINNKSDAATNLNSGPSRRSSRDRQNVSYDEVDDDYNVPLSSLKRSRGSKLSENKENSTLNNDSRSHDLPTDVDAKTESKETSGIEAGNIPDASTEIESDSDADAEYEDSEFYDFEKDRNVNCFSVNQLWACYDSLDGMPRFYAKLKKVCASPFKMTITWLEAVPADDKQEKWFNEELPIGCGTFKLGDTEPNTRFMFSHQVQCKKGKKRGSLVIEPRLGEVWAIYKDWDFSWSVDPENHRMYKYEIVEVKSDFDEKVGSSVCYLAKVEGFISLFQRSVESSTNSFMIRPNELYKFSHRIPCHKMTGSEREGVPVGCFELDPASLPLNHDDLYWPGK